MYVIRHLCERNEYGFLHLSNYFLFSTFSLIGRGQLSNQKLAKDENIGLNTASNTRTNVSLRTVSLIRNQHMYLQIVRSIDVRMKLDKSFEHPIFNVYRQIYGIVDTSLHRVHTN